MTEEERQAFYDSRQRYKWQCEEFKEEMKRYLEHYKPRRHENTNSRAD